MNLYVYLKMPKPGFGSLSGPYSHEACRVLADIEESGLPLAEQKQLQKKFLREFSEQKENRHSLIETWTERMKQERRKIPQWTEWLDLIVFVPMWVILFDGILQSDPGSFWTMRLTVGMILETFSVYLIMKGVAEAVARDVQGWKRWALMAGLFALYLCSLALGRKLDYGFSAPKIAVFLILAFLGIIGFFLLDRHYEPEKQRIRFKEPLFKKKQ